MATRSLTNGPGVLRNPPSGALREEDYRNFCAALESTQRGRDFLTEYGRRNRNADTEILLDSLDRIETMIKAEGAARDRLQDELRVLLIAIRLARPDINSATALTKAARLVDLLDLMERRIDAMVENKDLPPITEEPSPAPAALSVVPRPDEPELPIPSFASVQPPPMALVHDVTIQELLKQELSKQERAQPELPRQDRPRHRLPQPEPVAQETPPEFATLQAPPEETAIQALARQEALFNAPPKRPVNAYPVFAEADAAPAKAPEEKWLPDFGTDETQIIHTQPVRAMAFMPEVTFLSAPVSVAAAPVVGKAVDAAQAERAPATVRAQLRDHPLAAIMSLSEEERIALFT